MFQTDRVSGPTQELAGILKGGRTAKPRVLHKAAKFNELNVLETFHPANKDYGHMVIDEPKTPFVRDTDEETTGLDTKELLEKLHMASDGEMPSFGIDNNSDDTSDDDYPESIEERARRIVFERRRKAHYKEFKSVPLARRLIMEEFGDMSQSASELSVNEEIPTASIEEYQQEDQSVIPSFISSDTDDDDYLAVLEGKKKKSTYIEVEPGSDPSHPCYHKLKAEIPTPAQTTYSLVTPPSVGSSLSIVSDAANTSKYAFENIIPKPQTSHVSKRSALKKSKGSTEETTAAKK